jgi:hypothetical protein
MYGVFMLCGVERGQLAFIFPYVHVFLVIRIVLIMGSSYIGL